MEEKIYKNIKSVLDFYSSLDKDTIYNNNHHYNDNSFSMVYSRLERASFNQVENGRATCSRYAIWAADVRAIIEEAMKELDDDTEKAKESLRLAVNVMGAYIDIQSVFDALPNGMQFIKPDDIFNQYAEFKKVLFNKSK